MQIHRFDSANKFYERVGGYLRQREVNHNLLLRICHTLLHSPDRYPSSPYLAAIESGGKTVAVALRTPPFPLLLSHMEDLEACKPLAEDLLSCQHDLSGVNGPSPESESFAQVWQGLTGQTYALQMGLRLHQLNTVQSSPLPQGFYAC